MALWATGSDTVKLMPYIMSSSSEGVYCLTLIRDFENVCLVVQPDNDFEAAELKYIYHVRKIVIHTTWLLLTGAAQTGLTI